MTRFATLLSKEFALEFKEQYALAGLILYVFSTLFILAISLAEIDEALWVSLFWIIMLFTALNSVLRSFVKEPPGRHFYYYTLVHPVEVYATKSVFNILVLTVLGGFCYFGLSVIGGHPIVHVGVFAGAFFLGIIGMGCSFSLLGYMSNLASGNTALLSIIGFPLIIPIMLQVVKIGLIGCGLLSMEGIASEFYILIAIDLLIIALGIWLFPYLWRK